MVDKLNEFELIANVFGPLAANAPGSLNLSDDAAIICLEAIRKLSLPLIQLSRAFTFVLKIRRERWG